MSDIQPALTAQDKGDELERYRFVGRARRHKGRANRIEALLSPEAVKVPGFKSGRPDSVTNGLTSSCGVGPFCDILEAQRERGNYGLRFDGGRGDERLLGGVRDEWRSEWSADGGQVAELAAV